MTLIMFKLFIAVILQSYNDIKLRDERLFNEDMRNKFLDTWEEFDPEGSGYISRLDLRDFLMILGDPLGFKPSISNDLAAQDKFMAALELQTHHNDS